MSVEPDDDLQADLYVLGLLGPSDHAEAERRMDREPAFAARVLRAAQRFAPLDDTAAVPALPTEAWARLDARLATVGRSAAPPPDPSPVPANLRRAPHTAILAWAATLALAIGLAWTWLQLSPQDPLALAVILPPGGGAPVALVEDFGGGEVEITALAEVGVPEGRSLQVWTKWSDDVGPVSLGVLERLEGARVGGPGVPDPVAGQLYEITLEEEGGSPTGRPTGPILGVGLASLPN